MGKAKSKKAKGQNRKYVKDKAAAEQRERQSGWAFINGFPFAGLKESLIAQKNCPHTAPESQKQRKNCLNCGHMCTSHKTSEGIGSVFSGKEKTTAREMQEQKENNCKG